MGHVPPCRYFLDEVKYKYTSRKEDGKTIPFTGVKNFSRMVDTELDAVAAMKSLGYDLELTANAFHYAKSLMFFAKGTHPERQALER